MSEDAAAKVKASDEFRKMIEGAVDASTLQQLLRNHQEREAAAAQSPAAPASAPPHAVSQEPPPNFSNSNTFFAVGYKGNSRMEVFEYDREAFDKAIETYIKMGWVF